MRADNLIVFGRTVPEDSKKYGQSVCMAGYYPELKQMMRIYPLPISSSSHVKSRHYITAEIERNNLDSRIESWTLKNREINSIKLGSKCNDSLIKESLKYLSTDSIDLLNDKRLSLGVLNPESFEIILKTRDEIPNPQQLTLFDDFKESIEIKTASNYFAAPYVLIPSQSSQKCFQIREWGVYELIRKFEAEGKTLNATIIKNALHIEENCNVFFVVGNMNHNRTIWIVIKVFCFKKEPIQMEIL